MLGGALGLREFATHTSAELDWQSLPDDAIVQLHWSRSADFEALLSEHGFRPICVVRHPLDVLISILHFCAFEPETGRWLDGAGGSESSIISAGPLSRRFLDYCLSDRAAQLLAVGAGWVDPQNPSGAVPILRYEQLVSDPQGCLGAFIDELDLTPVNPLAKIVSENSLSRSRLGDSKHHFWLGQPGNWRRLLPASAAYAIQARHQRIFEILGYDCCPDPDICVADVERTWKAISCKSTARERGRQQNVILSPA